MTRIDFHTNIKDKLQYACRVARKAYAAGAKVVLLADSPEQASQLDEALWTLGDTAFIPHVMDRDPLAAETPVIVTDSDEAALPHYDVLVNLTRSTPTQFAQFARMFEIISTDEQDEAAGRQRYAAYKKQSYPLTHIVAGQT
jgi:DNA polymerase-3 subunit chi